MNKPEIINAMFNIFVQPDLYSVYFRGGSYQIIRVTQENNPQDYHNKSYYPETNGPREPVSEETAMKYVKRFIEESTGRPITCRACEIEKNDEQVKQMPEHICGKGPKRELPQPKSQS
jgi:hypothetical protein